VRFLAWHLESFRATPTEKGHSQIVEEASTVEAENSLLVFANFEKSDEANQGETVSKATNEIVSVCSNLKIGTVILDPFAHLFAEPSTPESAVSMLRSLEASLRGNNLLVKRLAFGMFYELEIKAKGHRYSRIARRI
jgi:threonyl-tRNA synthetase